MGTWFAALSRDENAELVWKTLLILAWTQAVVATFGSLYFSEVMDLPPCVLCWYQRICMYPMAVITTVAILRNDRGVHLYLLPLVVIGLGISLYHNLLYFGVLPESIQPCTAGVSCTSKQLEWLGFITIPLMALVAFSVMLVLTAGLTVISMRRNFDGEESA